MPKKETTSEAYSAGRAKIVAAMKKAQADGQPLNKNQIMIMIREHNQGLGDRNLKSSKNFGNAKINQGIFFKGTNDGSSTDSMFKRYGGRSLAEMKQDKLDAAKNAEEQKKEVIAPATLEENHNRFYNKEGKAGEFPNTEEPSDDRMKVIRKSVKDGSMTNLADKVTEKYGTEYYNLTGQDAQMAGNAMLGPDGEILPMSSASGQYSGSAMPKKAPRGFKMPGYGNKK